MIDGIIVAALPYAIRLLLLELYDIQTIGIFVAAIVCVGLFFTWRRFKPKENATVASLKADVSVEEGRPGHQKNPSFLIIEAEGIDSTSAIHDRIAGSHWSQNHRP